MVVFVEIVTMEVVRVSNELITVVVSEAEASRFVDCENSEQDIAIEDFDALREVASHE